MVAEISWPLSSTNFRQTFAVFKRIPVNLLAFELNEFSSNLRCLLAHPCQTFVQLTFYFLAPEILVNLPALQLAFEVTKS